LAKTSPHILSPERFALHIGAHIAKKYAHIHKVFVTVEKLRWARIPVPIVDGQDGGETKEHGHSFYRDGDDKTIVEAEVRNIASSGSISNG
jgi:urate oxidase